MPRNTLLLSASSLFLACFGIIHAAEPVPEATLPPEPPKRIPFIEEHLPFVHGYSPVIDEQYPGSTTPGCSPRACQSVRRCQPGCNATAKSRLQYKYWGYPEEFCERPFGTLVRTSLNTQAANAMAAQLALYEYDFQDSQLTSRGKYQLAKIAELMPFHAGPIVVETTGNAEMDQARRSAVVDELVKMGMPIDDQLVVSSRARTSGLMGIEALDIFLNQAQQTKSKGGGLGGSTGAGISAAPTTQ